MKCLLCKKCNFLVVDLAGMCVYSFVFFVPVPKGKKYVPQISCEKLVECN